MAMIVRYILVTEDTAGHLELLQSKGYDAKIVGDHIEVQASEVIEGTVDLSTPEKAKEVLPGVIQKKAVFSYTTRFILRNKKGEVKTYWGVPACKVMGKTSALVTKGEEKRNGLDDIFDMVG